MTGIRPAPAGPGTIQEGILRLIFGHLRSHGVAYLALFIALGSTSYAAIKIPNNSVGNKQLKKDAVDSAKVKNGTLLKDDFKAGQLPPGAKGDKGDSGPPGLDGQQGLKGDKGDQGDSGTSSVTTLVLNEGTATFQAIPAGPPTLAVRTTSFTTSGPSSSAIMAGRLAASLTCPGATTCQYSYGFFVDGAGVSGSSQSFKSVPDGATQAQVFETNGRIGGIPAGTHSLVLGIKQTTGDAMTAATPSSGTGHILVAPG